jgi:sugar lactone lactonase YvrE
VPTAPAEIPPAGATAPPSYVVGGTLSGLASNTRLVLLDNGGDALTLAANGAFSFAGPVAFNTAYAVSVGTQPLWQNCSVSNGNGTATADVNSVQVNCVEAQAQVSTFAGSSTRGSSDGTGVAASFSTLQAVAVDTNGTVYVADTDNHMIRKISPTGVVTTLAGSTTPGSANGTGTAARFKYPDGVAVDLSGNVYVADWGNHMIRKIAPDGVVTTLAGSTAPGSTDGNGPSAQFNGPGGLAVDANGNLYVADIGNHMIRKIAPDGVVTTLAGSTTRGAANGRGAAASFNSPNNLRLDADGNIYVADSFNHMIRKITPDGLVTTVAGSTTPGFADGTGAGARFFEPWGIGVDASGYLYVVESRNSVIRKITPDGVVTTLAGSQTRGSADGIGAAAQFKDLYDVTTDLNGNLYVLDGPAVRKITPVR